MEQNCLGQTIDNRNKNAQSINSAGCSPEPEQARFWTVTKLIATFLTSCSPETKLALLVGSGQALKVFPNIR